MRISNLNEYLAGTDPQNGAKVLKAKSVTKSGNELIITFNTVPGRVYQIDTSPTLAPGSWSILVPLKHALSAETSITLPYLPAKRFYRARIAD